MLGRGRAAPARRAVPPWAALAGWIGGHLVTAPCGQEDGQTGHRPDAGQGPDGSRAARYTPLGGPARAGGRYLVLLRAVRRTARRATSGPPEGHWLDAGQRLGGSGRVDGRHLVAAPGSQQDGQAGHQRAEQKAAVPDTWQRPGSSGAVCCGSLGGSEVAYVSCSDTISALRSPSNPQAIADLGRSWPSGWAAPGHGSVQSWRTARRPTSGPSRRQRGRMLGNGLAAPARRAASPWVALAIINPIFTVLIL